MKGTTPDMFGGNQTPRRVAYSRVYRDRQFFVALTHRLKRAQVQYNRKRGPNPAFPWSSWGDTPRSGAKWTDVEIKSLFMTISTMQQSAKLLNLDHLCELAWIHGRSVEGMRNKLTQLFNFKEYYEIFGDDL